MGMVRRREKRWNRQLEEPPQQTQEIGTRFSYRVDRRIGADISYPSRLFATAAELVRDADWRKNRQKPPRSAELLHDCSAVHLTDLIQAHGHVASSLPGRTVHTKNKQLFIPVQL
jgi:hypothetical protein